MILHTMMVALGDMLDAAGDTVVADMVAELQKRFGISMEVDYMTRVDTKSDSCSTYYFYDVRDHGCDIHDSWSYSCVSSFLCCTIEKSDSVGDCCWHT